MAPTDLNRIDGLRQIRQKKNNAFNPNFYEKSGISEQVSTGLEALIFRTSSGGALPRFTPVFTCLVISIT